MTLGKFSRFGCTPQPIELVELSRLSGYSGTHAASEPIERISVVRLMRNHLNQINDAKVSISVQPCLVRDGLNPFCRKAAPPGGRHTHGVPYCLIVDVVFFVFHHTLLLLVAASGRRGHVLEQRARVHSLGDPLLAHLGVDEGIFALAVQMDRRPVAEGDLVAARIATLGAGRLSAPILR